MPVVDCWVEKTEDGKVVQRVWPMVGEMAAMWVTSMVGDLAVTWAPW